MTHQFHRRGHIVIALRLLRQTGSLDQLLPVSHPLCSKTVSRSVSVAPRFGRSSHSSTHLQTSARPGQHTRARRKCEAAAHVRVDQRAFKVQTDNLNVYIDTIQRSLSPPGPLSSKCRLAPFFPPLSALWGSASASVLSIPANGVEGRFGGARARCISG